MPSLPFASPLCGRLAIVGASPAAVLDLRGVDEADGIGLNAAAANGLLGGDVETRSFRMDIRRNCAEGLGGAGFRAASVERVLDTTSINDGIFSSFGISWAPISRSAMVVVKAAVLGEHP